MVVREDDIVTQCNDCKYYPGNCDLLLQDYFWGDGQHHVCEFWTFNDRVAV